jgi:steroid delta-isomerase-like uncharacterized protein
LHVVDTMARFYDSVNARDVEAFMGELADDFVEHDEMPGLTPDKAGVRRSFESLLSAFPDLRFEVEDIFAADDKGVARIRITGTHEGEFIGIPATGRPIDVRGIDIIRFAEGKAVEHWGMSDMLKLLQQLGVVPEPG